MFFFLVESLEKYQKEPRSFGLTINYHFIDNFKRWYSKNFVCLLSFFFLEYLFAELTLITISDERKDTVFGAILCEVVYSFLFGVITDCHKLSDLKKIPKFIILQSWRSHVQHKCHQAKIRSWKVWVPFWRLEGRTVFSLFPASRGCPYLLAHGPFLHFQSQQWWVESSCHFSLNHSSAFLF